MLTVCVVMVLVNHIKPLILTTYFTTINRKQSLQMFDTFLFINYMGQSQDFLLSDEFSMLVSDSLLLSLYLKYSYILS